VNMKASSKAVAFNAAKGAFEGVTPIQIEAWEAAYPGLAVRKELARAECWLLCNPSPLAEGNALPFIEARFRRLQRQAGRETAYLAKSFIRLASGEFNEGRVAVALASGKFEGVRAMLDKISGQRPGGAHA
jgi:hypothetical protein